MHYRDRLGTNTEKEDCVFLQEADELHALADEMRAKLEPRTGQTQLLQELCFAPAGAVFRNTPTPSKLQPGLARSTPYIQSSGDQPEPEPEPEPGPGPGPESRAWNALWPHQTEGAQPSNQFDRKLQQAAADGTASALDTAITLGASDDDDIEVRKRVFLRHCI